VIAGREDTERAASALASRLPWPLGVLGRLAYNYRWSWLPDGPELFRQVDPHRWRMCGSNPVRLLQEASAESLLRAAANDELIARAEAAEQAIIDDLARPPRDEVVGEDHPVAFFCAEYAVHQSLPIYSGGLGALAGDILKEASDLALPFVAVGLMYRRGYFRQRIDVTGWQQEFWVPTDPERTPAVLITTEGHKRTPLKITVPIGDQDVVAQIWRVNVGRVPLFLLDTELPENDGVSRWITSRLYDGDTGTRLTQYTLLGVGGIIALRALGIDPGIIHMNEGHAALTALETARGDVKSGASFDEAFARARERTVFTTHTPVPAGNDTYPPEQVRTTLERIVGDSGTDLDHLLRLGRTNPDDGGEPFGVTQLALRSSRAANGVAKRHGIVSRSMWHGMWPDRDVDDVPITHVTNGVHVPSWVGAPMRRLLDRHLGEGWALRSDDPQVFAPIDDIPAAELWDVRNEQRRLLCSFIRDRSVHDRVTRGDTREYAVSAAQAFDPDVLTIGFARRLATYKRLNLLLYDAQRALNLIDSDRPIQVLLAGKAHPKDDEGKKLVQNLFAMRGERGAGSRVVFVEDYDLGVAARLVRGCDVWVNVPRPPLEASGTSGMKSVVNGGLQLSVLDGWWWEAYDGSNGWAMNGDEDADHGAQDHRAAEDLYGLLETQVVPEFHDRDADGIPQAWVARVKRSMRTLIPQFSATRMVKEYEQRIYKKVS
jgi:starch phosphorylase